MADEYTPTTEDVREAWAKRNALYRSTSLTSIGHRAHVATNADRYSAEDYAEFDRWLAAHDREVAAKALREAADEVLRRRALVRSSGDVRDDETWDNGNMSAEATIRARADRIESQAIEKGASDGEQ